MIVLQSLHRPRNLTATFVPYSGIILYRMLFGIAPFWDENEALEVTFCDVSLFVTRSFLQFHVEANGEVTADARALVQSMLQNEATERTTATVD